MAPDAALLDAPTPVGAFVIDTPEVDVRAPVAALATASRRRLRLSPCSGFAWGAAGSGGLLFLAGLVEAAGTWALSAGAVSLTVASVAGVIAMEGCEERSPGPSPRRGAR